MPINKSITFGGKRYERTGGDPVTKIEADRWANFNRKTNNLKVRVVKVKGGYVPYIRRGEAEKVVTASGTYQAEAKTKTALNRAVKRADNVKGVDLSSPRSIRITPRMKKLPR